MQRVIVGGSFVTAKPTPNDVDVIIVLDDDVDVEALNQSQYTMADRDALRRTLKGNDFDVIIVRANTLRMQTIIEFFQSNRDNKPVGVVEVELYGNS